MSTLLRIPAVLAVALVSLASLAAGAFFFWWSGVVLSKIFADYRDGAVATYLIIGLVLLGIAVACFVAAVLLVAAAVRVGSGGRRLRQ